MTPRYVRNVGIQTGSFSFSSQLNSFCPPPKKNVTFSSILASSHNKPILITAERGREEGEGAENWKRETSKSVWDTHGFLTLGHSNWSICSQLNWFCPKKIPPFYPASHNKPFLITAERERGGRKEHWGIQIGPLAACWMDFTQPISHYCRKRKEGGCAYSAYTENGKRDLSKTEWDTGVSICSLYNRLPVYFIVIFELNPLLNRNRNVGTYVKRNL